MLDPLWALPSHEALTHSGALAEFSPEQGSVEERFGQMNTTDLFKRYAYYNDRTLIEDPQYKGSHYRAFHSLWESSTSSPSSTDYFNDYGWAAYGNQPLEEETYGEGKAGYFDLKYDFDWGVWMQFLRTGENRWKEMAEASSRYQEQLILHEVITETGWDVARWKNAVFGHAQHNETGNTNGARNYLGPVIDTAWGARGAALHYYLTGYEPSRQFAEDFAAYAYDFYKDRRESDYLWNGYERSAANLLSVLVEGYALTGNKHYQELAHELMVYYAPEKQPCISGPISNNTNDFVRPWMLATYLSAVGRYAVTMEEIGNTSEAQFAQNHLMGYVEWIKKYGLFESNGWLTTNYSYYVNNDARNRDKGNTLINNWTFTLADVFAYAYAFKGDEKDLERAAAFFKTGTSNPYFEHSPLI